MSLPWLIVFDNTREERREIPEPREPFLAIERGDDISFDLSNFQSAQKMPSKEDAHPTFRHLTMGAIQRDPDKPQFDRGISFINVFFSEDVDFSDIEFNGPLIFWGCTFKKGFKLDNSEVKAGVEVVHRDSAEVNFSYCVFEERPSFRRAVFNGRGYFHRTIFRKGADFTGAKFRQPVVFEASESDICLPKAELKSGLVSAYKKKAERTVRADGATAASPEELADQALLFLLNKHLIYPCQDSKLHVNFDTSIISAEGLKQKLDRLLSRDAEGQQQSIEIPEDGISAIRNLWGKRYASSMFSDPFLKIHQIQNPHPDLYKNVSERTFIDRVKLDPREQKQRYWEQLTHFSGVLFAEGSAFRHADLAYCTFSGSNVDRLDFVVCRWADRRCHRLLGKLKIIFRTRRCAVRDELEVDRRAVSEEYPEYRNELTSRREELNELYRELRRAYDKEGDTITGRDFYFGELEMQRLSLARRKRIANSVYKHFAGYSKQEGLAFFWLIVFVVLIFPASFFWISYREHISLHRDVQRVSEQAERIRTAEANMVKRTEDAAVDAKRIAVSGQKQGSVKESQRLAADVAISNSGETQSSTGLLVSAPTEPVKTPAGQADIAHMPKNNVSVQDVSCKDQAVVKPLTEDPICELSVLVAADKVVWGDVKQDEQSDWRGALGGASTAFSSSLYASSFWSSAAEANSIASSADSLGSSRLILWEWVRRILDGVERLIVVAQLALLFICLRSRFQRLI